MTTSTDRSSSTTDMTALDLLGRMVLKRGLRLGLLNEEERAAMLALVWNAVPGDNGLTERQINEVLRSALDGPAACLAVDHVELRRWLCDAGWLQRDGFGREYRRVDADLLPQRLQAWGLALQGPDLSTWVKARVDGQQAERQTRQQSWLARQRQDVQAGPAPQS